MLSTAIIHWLCPFRGCIIATFITKTWLSTLMWDTNSVTCCWHCRHVFLFRSIYMCGRPRPWPWPRGLGLGLGLLVLALTSALVLAFWPFNITSCVMLRCCYSGTVCSGIHTYEDSRSLLDWSVGRRAGAETSYPQQRNFSVHSRQVRFTTPTCTPGGLLYLLIIHLRWAEHEYSSVTYTRYNSLHFLEITWAGHVLPVVAASN